MKRRIIAIGLVFFMILLPARAIAETGKDETVYINLKHDGSVSDIRVVNHIYGLKNQGSFIDYGKYTSVKNLDNEITPVIEGDVVKWPLSNYGGSDLYYEGTVNKKLPVEALIKYYLDGKEIRGEELAGRNGHLRITFDVNHIDKTPKLMAQIQLPLNMDVFKNIRVTGGNKVITGSSANITFVSLPGEKQIFEVEMDGSNIELNPITISAVSSEFSLPAGVQSGLNELTGGLDKISINADKLDKGMGDVINGTGQLKAGMDKLGGGLNEVYMGSGRIYEESRKITSGMEDFHRGLSQLAENSSSMIEGIDAVSSGINKLHEGSTETYKGIEGLYSGTGNLSKGTNELLGGIAGLKKGHSQLTAIAGELLESPDPRVREMAKGIIEEDKALTELNGAAEQINSGAAQLEGGMGKLYLGLGEYNKSFTQLQAGMKEIAEKSKQLPGYLAGMNRNYGTLKDGTNKLFGGYGEINRALGEISRNLITIPDRIQMLINGQKDIKTGISRLNSEGIKRIGASVEDSLGELMAGTDDEASYTSFMDNERNKNSSVQFVMQTPGVEISENKKVEAVKEENKGFFERFLDLFRGK